MKTSLVRGAFVALTLLPGACSDEPTRTLPPLGQLLVYVDTDAPLPPPPGARAAPDDPPPLFDRVRIEVFRPGEPSPCAECTHEFDLDREMVAAGRASVGISPPVGVTGYRARVRLFSARFVDLAEPRADATLDSTVALPATAAEGITEVTVPLATETVAQVRGTPAEPAAARLGRPSPGFSGSWAGAKRANCTGTAGPDEVCVPGGAFWMGNPLARVFLQPGESLVMRLVVLSPFFMDKTEVTVGAFRASKLGSVSDPQPYSTGLEPGGYAPCTYTPTPGNDENLPVTCISWDRARAYCRSRGRDLQSEAQHQFVAGAFEGRLFLWGNDAPSCNDAVYARGHSFMEPLLTCPGEWVEPAGRGGRDRLDLPGGTIFDVAGNVAEYAVDFFQPYGTGCWKTGVVTDPVCEVPLDGPKQPHTLVGGSWAGLAASTAAASRGFTLDFAAVIANDQQRNLSAPALAGVGFRCARADD